MPAQAMHGSSTKRKFEDDSSEQVCTAACQLKRISADIGSVVCEGKTAAFSRKQAMPINKRRDGRENSITTAADACHHLRFARLQTLSECHCQLCKLKQGNHTVSYMWHDHTARRAATAATTDAAS